MTQRSLNRNAPTGIPVSSRSSRTNISLHHLTLPSGLSCGQERCPYSPFRQVFPMQASKRGEQMKQRAPVRKSDAQARRPLFLYVAIPLLLAVPCCPVQSVARFPDGALRRQLLKSLPDRPSIRAADLSFKFEVHLAHYCWAAAAATWMSPRIQDRLPRGLHASEASSWRPSLRPQNWIHAMPVWQLRLAVAQPRGRGRK